MNYSVLNKNQKDRMRAISNHAYFMRWEEPEFMDYLLGELPKVRKYQNDNLSWETQDKEKVIICNNNKNSYYRDPIGGTVFIRKDFLDKFLEEHTVKYFAFTERLIPETGYADETSLHFEIINGKIVKEIKNAGGYGRRNSESNPLCSVCPHTNIIENESDDSQLSDIEWLNNMLVKYGIADGIDTIDEKDF